MQTGPLEVHAADAVAEGVGARAALRELLRGRGPKGGAQKFRITCSLSIQLFSEDCQGLQVD